MQMYVNDPIRFVKVVLVIFVYYKGHHYFGKGGGLVDSTNQEILGSITAASKLFQEKPLF